MMNTILWLLRRPPRTNRSRKDQSWAEAARRYAEQSSIGWSAPGYGVKHDANKLPWHLVPFDAVEAIGRVLQFGAIKYSPRNWEKGMDWSRVYSAQMRHMVAWQNGEQKDPETGFSHLWHAGCCILFLIAFELRGVGRDDRPKIKSEAVPDV